MITCSGCIRNNLVVCHSERSRGISNYFSLREAQKYPEMFDAARHDKKSLSFPEKFRRATDFRWETFVDGAIQRGLFKNFALRMIGRERDMNF